jgi:hypothetical protein
MQIARKHAQSAADFVRFMDTIMRQNIKQHLPSLCPQSGTKRLQSRARVVAMKTRSIGQILPKTPLNLTRITHQRNRIAAKRTTMSTVVHAMKDRRKSQPFGVAHTPYELPVLINEPMTMQTVIHQVQYERIRYQFCSTDEQAETAVSSKRKAVSSHDTYPAFQPERNCPLPCSLAARQKIGRQSDNNRMRTRWHSDGNHGATEP